MKKKVLPNLVRATLGILVGLGIAEVVFRVRDEGAFAHVNVYLPDAELGARLKPGATEKIRFGSKANPVTSIRIDGDGYRGGGLPAPGPDEVVVVGDSQTFGLGVEEGETFSAVLAKELGGRTVRNLGVPTYGPGEYNAVLKESLAKRPAKTVVWIANMANDLFEANKPNRTRHVIWDGWAVRKESAPAHVAQFPGRSLLFTHSHAFLAARRWLYEKGEKDSEGGFASEGTWKDIGAAAEHAEKEHVAASAERERRAKEHEKAVDAAKEATREQRARVDRILEDKVPSAEFTRFVPERHFDDHGDDGNWISESQLLEASRLSPGDIVSVGYAEVERAVRVNAQQIARGVAMRNHVEQRLREDATRRGDRKTLGELAKRDELEAREKAAIEAAVETPVVLSPLAPALAEAQAICARAGARLVVVALPIDVQVSKDEWKKYRTEPIDMEDSRVLNADVVAAAVAVGAEGIDVLPALKAAEPGAFLDGDLHMTPKGHHAVGAALARMLKAPKLARPDEARALPANRSRAPLPEEWIPESEIAVRESDPAGCETKQVREWLGIFCRAKGGAKGVRVERGLDVLAGALPGQAMLVAPLTKGQDLHAVFAWDGETRDFDVKDDRILGFSKPKPGRTDIPGPPAEAAAYCACAGECAKARAPADADCARTYATDCKKLLACAAGARDALPDCAEGSARAGMAGRCRPLCSKEVACAAGACTSWQGGDVCM